jgi:hypothetical protein
MMQAIFVQSFHVRKIMFVYCSQRAIYFSKEM